MKKIIFVLCAILAWEAMAQSAFAPAGTEWNYTFTMNGNTGKEALKSAGDTIIEGLVYRKIIVNHVWRLFNNRILSETSTLLLSEKNDSVFINGRFQYTTAVRVGDTLHPCLARGIKTFLRVDSISSLFIFNKIRKAVYFSQGSYDCYHYEKRKITVVENYGPIDHYLEIEALDDCVIGTQKNSEFLCGSFDNVHYEGNPTYSCHPLEIINSSTVKPSYIIKEDPYGFKEIIFNKPTHGTIEVYNSLGIKLGQTHLLKDENSFKINFNNYPLGDYFLILFTEEGIDFLGKVLNIANPASL